MYYANYLKYAERARTEMMRALGADHTGLMERERVMMTVRTCNAEFLSPARLDDILEVHSSVEQVRGASMWLEQIIKRGGEELVHLKVRLACVGPYMKPAALPERLRARIGGKG